MAKETKTNAMRKLDTLHISYTEHQYDASDGHIDGVAVAAKCGLDPDQVFKTLVTQGNDRNFYVFVIPVREELDLKKCAKAAQVKSVEMIHVKDLLKTTGYIRGGCSPVGMKKLFTTTIHSTAENFERIFFSGGKIGCQVETTLENLKKIVPVRIADIIV